MIKVLIIDDEPLACELLAEYLQSEGDIEISGFCHDGFQGIKQIGELQPDLVFLDVQMPKLNGFEMLELLDSPPAIIFTTAFDEYAIKAFEANALDYLMKPFSQERLLQALSKFRNRQPEQGQEQENHKIKSVLEQLPARGNERRIVIKDGGRIRIIPLAEIFQLEADDDYVKIITAQGNFMKKKSLQYFEDKLDPTIFVRVHRSYLINTTQLVRIDPYQKNNHQALLKNGSKIPVSRAGYQKLREVLNI